MMRTILFTIALLVTLPLAFGQNARPLVGKDIAVPSARFPAEWYPKQGGSTTAPVAGAPYSATWTMTATVLDSEGKPIGTSVWRTLKWRDSAGRIRDEELLSEIPNTIANIPNEITAVDTVQHCQFTWGAPELREQDREAAVNCNSLEEDRGEDDLAREMTDPKPEIRHEQLGTMARTTTITPLGRRTMHGLEAVGIRSDTTDVDAGGKLQDTTEGEIWWSPELYESLLTTVKTHQTIVTMELSGVRREEPDPGLFYPPEGYHIRKETEVPPIPVPPPL
jgi:hypothetical protein